MFCTQCGTQLKENQRFCTNCGSAADIAASPTRVMQPHAPAPPSAAPSQQPPSPSSSAPAIAAAPPQPPVTVPPAQIPRSVAATAATTPKIAAGAAELGKTAVPRQGTNPVLLWSLVGALVVVAVAAVLLLLHFRGQPALSDADIEKSLQTKIQADPTLSKDTIEVRCEKGVVTLTGFVNQLSDRSAVGSIVLQQPGVKTVVDNLVVSAPSTGPQGSSHGYGSPEVNVPNSSNAYAGIIWLGFANGTGAQDRDDDLRRNCGQFQRVYVPESAGSRFTDLCRYLGKSCSRVCDWEGHTLSCDAVSMGGSRDGTRVVLCRQSPDPAGGHRRS